MADAPPVRPAARVVVLDPVGRVLLFGARLLDLATPPGPVLYWYTPGGQVEPGESVRLAAVRELREEIGLAVEPTALEGPVWLRRAIAPLLGVPVDHRETYFALRGVVHEVDVSGQTEIEAYEDQPHRWWSVAELQSSDETFVPAGLADAVEQLLEARWSGPPRIVD